jgi:hypothetical protein
LRHQQTFAVALEKMRQGDEVHETWAMKCMRHGRVNTCVLGYEIHCVMGVGIDASWAMKCMRHERVNTCDLGF